MHSPAVAQVIRIRDHAFMKEAHFGFEYTWADLQPVRALAVTVFASQIVGAIIGFSLHLYPRWLESLWFGAAVATLPAFVVGLVIQSKVKPCSLAQNKVMVRRLGLVATLLTAFALAMPLFGFAHESKSGSQGFIAPSLLTTLNDRSSNEF